MSAAEKPVPFRFTQPVELLERAYEARSKGSWIYIGSDNNSCRIVSNWIGKLFYILTDLIGRRHNDRKLAGVMDNAYFALMRRAEKAQNVAAKTTVLSQTSHLIASSEKLSKKVTKHVDREQLRELIKKTVDVGIEVLDRTAETSARYRRTLKEIEDVIAAYSEPLTSDPVIDESQRQSILLHARRIKIHDSSVNSLIELLTFPELHEIDRGKDLHKGKGITAGLSGSYILKDNKGTPCAIYKPDEETTGEVNNAHGPDRRMVDLTNIQPEKMSVREEAAYLLDRGFSRVPRTRKVTLRGINTEGKKRNYTTGSLQQWIQGARSFDQLDERELAGIPAEDLQRLAIQDLRWLNADRHFGNVLLDPDGRVVPIDHGFILPNKADRLVFNWMKFPQMKLKLTEECKRYILALDPQKDAQELLKLGIDEAAIARMEISTYLLQEGVRQGLSLHEIASIYINGDDPFTLNGMRTETSFFEQTIVRKVLLEKLPPHAVARELVANFKTLRDERLANPSQFRALGFKKGETIAPGITHYHYSHLLSGQPQSIHVMKIDRAQQDKYDLRVIDHRELHKEQDDFNPDLIDQRMPLSSAAAALPNAMAIVNGGYYHYSHDLYFWDLEKFDVSDPVGFLRTNGRDAMIRQRTPTANPLTPLWGVVKTSQDGSVSISSTSPDEQTELDEHTFEALGSGPVLVEDGKVQRISRNVQSIVSKRKIFQNKSYHSPGNFIEHYNERHPRTCFGKDAEGSWYMVVVDGRNVGGVGVTCQELAGFMKGLGCTHAINLDGGGSSQMMARSPDDKMRHLNHAGEPDRPITSSLAVVKKESSGRLFPFI